MQYKLIKKKQNVNPTSRLLEYDKDNNQMLMDVDKIKA